MILFSSMSSIPELSALVETSITHAPTFRSSAPPEDILRGRPTLQPKDYALMNDLPEELQNECRLKIEKLLTWMKERPMAGSSSEHEHYDVVNRGSENMTIEYDETLFVNKEAIGVRYYQLKIQKFGEYLPVDFSYETYIKGGITMSTEEVDVLCEPKEWTSLLTFDAFLAKV